VPGWSLDAQPRIKEEKKKRKGKNNSDSDNKHRQQYTQRRHASLIICMDKPKKRKK